MNLIFVDEKKGKSASFRCAPWAFKLGIACALVLISGVGFVVSEFRHHLKNNPLHALSYASVAEELRAQKAQVARIEAQSQAQLNALTRQLSGMNARLLRLDALGERVSELADIPEDEFQFSHKPAVGGGNDTDLGAAYRLPNLETALEALEQEIARREGKLGVLEALLDGRRLHTEVFIAGRPVERGWMSSTFGRRTDPFTGRLAWHNGVDFAGKENSKVLAVASGVVVWSGRKSGFGNLVEINHGGGYITRYAHNASHLVEVGDIVTKGEAIALMGSTGRSTGPHVHFEVLKDGKHVNPIRYVRRDAATIKGSES